MIWLYVFCCNVLAHTHTHTHTVIRINHEKYLIVYIYSVFQQIIELIMIKSNY